MPTALEEFARETIEKLLKNLPAEKRLELVKELPAEKRLELVKELPAEKRRELVKEIPVEELVAGLSPEQRVQLVRKLKENGASGDMGH
jgi:Mg/Co/Ni transporter MgtE